MMRKFVILFCMVCCSACAGRIPIPVGEVPPPRAVTSEDEQYGQGVFNDLSSQFKISNDDAKIRRVRDIVDKLAISIHGQDLPWHIYVLDAPDVKNAAATKGDYVFVWSGMIDAVQSDAELAAILSHEIGHVLAGHTQPTPGEEAAAAVSGVSGGIVGQVATMNTGQQVVGQLAEALAKEAMDAIFVNPESRRKELEADQIGLFIMADAGYDPQAAVSLWKRMSETGEVDAPFAMLSTHPQSAERFAALEKLIPQAEARYQLVKNGGLKKVSEWEVPESSKPIKTPAPFVPPPTKKFNLTPPHPEAGNDVPLIHEFSSKVEKNEAGEWVSKP